MSSRILLIALLAVGGMSALAQEAYVLSPRLGPVIDMEERAYFGLFPGIDGFVSARAVADGDEVRFAIEREGATVAVTIPRATVETLGRFVETFEHASTAFYNPNWQPLKGLVRADIPVPYVDARRPDVRLDLGDRRYAGILLRETDSLVVLQPAAKPYDWRLPNAIAFPTAAIDRVAFEPQGLERFYGLAPYGGGMFGALVGATASQANASEWSPQTRYVTVPLFAGIGYELARRLWPKPKPAGTYAERREVLRERARFSEDLVPFDFPAPAVLRGPADAYSYEQASRDRPGLYRRWIQRYGLVSVGFMAGLSTTNRTAPEPYTEFVRGVGERMQEIPTNDFDVTGGVDLSLRPLPWLRVGGSWLAREDEVLEETEQERVNVTPSAVRGYAELILPSPQLGCYRVDLAAGIGIEENAWSVVRVSQNPDPAFTYRFDDSFSNTYWQATLEVFSSRRVSYFARYTQRSLSRTQEVEGVELSIPGLPGTLAYSRPAHTVEMRGYSDLFWGTRIHF